MKRPFRATKRQTVHSWAAAALLLCCSFAAMAIDTSSSFRDPFERKPREPGKEIGNGSPRRPMGADGRPEPKPPKESTKIPMSSPLGPLDNLIKLYLEWTKATYSPLWRETVVFTADSVRAYATEELTKELANKGYAYLTGRGWNVVTAAKYTSKTIGASFILLDLFWPSEIGMEPTPDEMERSLRRLQEQRRKEALPETKKRPAQDLPGQFRNPASEAPPTSSSVSTEEERRRAMFADQTLTSEQAQALLVRGAGVLHGPKGGQLLEAMLWLYDMDRIEREGLSEEAEALYDELIALSKRYQEQRESRMSHNACVIAPPKWKGTPTRWTCTLPATQKYAECFCPPPPNYFGPWIEGFPTRMQEGHVCVISRTATCPMGSASPLGGFCSCPGFPGMAGQVRM